MDYNNFSKQELVNEVKKISSELQEAQDLISSIRNGEIDAVVVQRDEGDQIYVLDDANIFYRRMIEEMNEGAVTFGSDGYILYSNKAFAGMLKYSHDGIISKPVTNYIHPAFHSELQNNLRSIMTRPLKSSIKLLNKSGKSIPVQISLHKIIMNGIEVFLMTVTDEREKLYIKKLNLHQIALEKLASRLREAKNEAEEAVKLLKEKNKDYSILNTEYIHINNILTKTNEELLIAKKKAEKSDQLKSSFIANMSHEIRTPLNSIIGYTKILMDSVKDEDQIKQIDVIKHSGNQLLHIINDIVDISMLEAREMKIVESETDLISLMQKALDQLKAYARNIDKEYIDLRVKLPEESEGRAVIYTDEFRVQQILSNLLSNALKYTEKGFIEFGFEITEGKDELIFFVRDSGMGINQKDYKIIFDRFRQGRPPSKQVISGTGLGLAISNGLTGLLGGKMWVESQMGSGSVFYFSIPYKKVESPTTSQLPEDKVINSVTPHLEGKKILICEDDLFSREMLVYMLTKTKAELLVATDGKESMDKFRQYDIDLVLLDLRLPEKDGYQVIKEIRSMNKDAIVIAQTAYAMLDEVRKFREAGFNDYLTKPINDEKLYGILHKYLC